MKTKHKFETEVKQILDIVIHSLYTDKEIFVRELVSNASDALEKMRHIEITEKDNVFDNNLKLEININTDDKANTITIADYGIGMTRQELQENIGTIAHSGTKKFLKALQENKEQKQASNNLIGQFGVGFYSAFMVSDDVKIYTHSWDKNAEHLCWSSDGASGYSIEESPGQRRGTKIVIKLKDDCKEFSGSARIKEILEKYSSFVPFPINLNGEQVNKIEAIWLKNKSEISKEKYTEFYKFQAKAFDEPMYHMHFSADAPININALVFVPQSNPEIMGFGQVDPSVALHCKKILIDDKPKNLIPDWLRFLKGVIDSEDIPLNISRESMQDSVLITKINNVVTKKFIKFLQQEAKKNPESYNKFYQQFNRFIKEGIATDITNKDDLAKLLRFETSMTKDKETTSLQEYLERSRENQKEIYYIINTNGRDAIEKGPYLEAFKKRNLEVIFFYELIDEYVLNSLTEFDGKKLKSVDSEDIELEEVPDEKNESPKIPKDDIEKLCTWIKETLGEKVEKVTTSNRLSNSPAMVLTQDSGMSPQLRKMMMATSGQDPTFLKDKMTLEINPNHELVAGLNNIYKQKPKAELAKKITEQIYQNSLITAGIIENQTEMVDRIYDIMQASITTAT